MGLMNKLNKLTDWMLKFGIILLAFAGALIPIIFLLGHETLHQQPWDDSLAQHSARSSEVQVAKTLEVSNIYLKEKGSISSTDVTDTLELADFVCYTLQSQGEAVVRRNIETKAGKKGKKKGDANNIEGYKVSTSLHENPPLKGLKNKLSKMIDFQSDSLTSKYWVIVISGHFDNKIADQIDNIDTKNSDYKFIIVSPLPVSHKIISEVPAASSEPEQTNEPVAEPVVQEEVQEPEVVEEAVEQPPAQEAEPQAEEEPVAEEPKPEKKKKKKSKKSQASEQL